MGETPVLQAHDEGYGHADMLVSGSWKKYTSHPHWTLSVGHAFGSGLPKSSYTTGSPRSRVKGF